MSSFQNTKPEESTIASASYSTDKTGVNDKKTAITLTDNRPSAIAQRKLIQIANENVVQRKPNNTGLPDTLKSGIENLSGHAMDDVKVHYNSNKPAQLNAHAYAQGTDIHVASGQEKHLAHEAWHVVQQKQGRVKPTLQLKGKYVNDNRQLEKEADVMGNKALQLKTDVVSQLKSVSGPNAIIQRKVGVEYETNWKVNGNNRINHKKPIVSDSSWHLESDNNNLEFVTYPPSNSPEQLQSTVASMASTALHIRGAVGNFAVQNVGTILHNAKPLFSPQHFVQSSDAAMSAKAQFSFGLSLKNMTAFFDKLASGNIIEPGAPGGGTQFSFAKRYSFGRGMVDDNKSTKGFLEDSIAPGIAESNVYRRGMKDFAGEHSPEMQGFLSYMAYSIKAMEKEYNDNQEKLNKSAHLAQELLKSMGSPGTVLQVAQRIGYNGGIVDYLNEGVFGNQRTTHAIIDPNQQVSSLKKFKGKLHRYVTKRVKKGMDYPKYRFIVMNRSGFDKMFQSMNGEDRKWFRQNIDNIIAKIGRNANEPVFFSPYTFKTRSDEDDMGALEKGFSKGPTLKSWLLSIAVSTKNKRDSLSPPKEFIMGDGKHDPDQSMGILAKMDESIVRAFEKDKEGSGKIRQNQKKVKQAIFELRSWGDYIKPQDWAQHSYEMAYLFAQMAPGDLTLEGKNLRMQQYGAELNPLLQKQEELKASIIPFNANATKGQKTHRRLFNRGVRDKLLTVKEQILVVEKKYRGII